MQKAREELDQAKSRYEDAETAFQHAELIHAALGASQSLVARSIRDELCVSCQAISVESIFKSHQANGKSFRRKVGDLFHAVENQASCRACKFLIEAFQIGDESHSETLHAGLKPRDTAIYFANDPDGKAWYTKAGIETSLPPCPFVWLQTGGPTATGQPHICITFEPNVDAGVNDDSHEARASPRRREPLEAFNGSVNYPLITSWLGKCGAEHGANYQQKDTSDLPLCIYLIDVKSRKLVRRQAGQRFVALSYVWGERSQVETQRVPKNENVRSSDWPTNGMTGDPVQPLPPTIPQTMEDAITFVDHLDEQFLWIDELCIDQTDSEEKQKQIELMDQIYASAYLTIVALDGPHADWGLPGISRPLLQTHQPTLRLDEGQVMATFIYSNWDNNGNSVWDNRGWTLQERLLSQRCIVFAKNHLSMTCPSEYFHDCLALDSANSGVQTYLSDDYFREDGSDINLDDMQWNLKTYDALVSVFTGRKLTYQGDVMSACRGSFNRLEQKTGMKFIYGLPTGIEFPRGNQIDPDLTNFFRALIWVPHHAHVLERRPGFVSWSWIGWIGRIEYPYFVSDMALYIDKDPRQQRSQGSVKRRRLQPPETDGHHIERAKVRKWPFPEYHHHLELTSTIAKFKVRLVRRNRETLRNLKANSQQSKTAIGDHWTLVGGDNEPLRDYAGEYPQFEVTDSFFRIKSEYSEILLAQGNEADFAFVEHYPYIRDSEASNMWLYDMVSALLIIRNPDGTAWRIASVLLKFEDWLAKNPQSENVRLV